MGQVNAIARVMFPSLSTSQIRPRLNGIGVSSIRFHLLGLGSIARRNLNMEFLLVIGPLRFLAAATEPRQSRSRPASSLTSPLHNAIHGRVLTVLHLNPMIAPASPVGAISALGHHTFQAKAASCAE